METGYLSLVRGFFYTQTEPTLLGPLFDCAPVNNRLHFAINFNDCVLFQIYKIKMFLVIK